MHSYFDAGAVRSGWMSGVSRGVPRPVGRLAVLAAVVRAGDFCLHALLAAQELLAGSLEPAAVVA